MKCLNCKSECMESELENGLCYECIEEYKATHNSNFSSVNSIIKNSTAKNINRVLRFFMVNGYFLGIIFAIAFIAQDDILFGIIFGYVCCITTWIFTTILKAIPEALQLLEDIKNK